VSVVLAVASHPDDEILGCGATMARMSEEGAQVHILIMGEGITSRQDARDRSVVQEELQRLHADVQAAASIVGAVSAEVLEFPDNRFDSVPLLELVKAVERKKSEVSPTVILTHHANDLNIDHRCTFEAVMTACRPVEDEAVREILSFEVPSSTEWRAPTAGNAFLPVQYVAVTADHVERKISAMEAYGSERRAYPHPRSPEALRALAQWRGCSVGTEYAEAFEVIRKLV
jgi:LmbE family N-acetylglucosaminyl deacetylase